MKKYLLTWYGITDLRAAFGFEKSDGPVLGALKSGDYTEVVILSYTDKNKVDPPIKLEQKDTDEWKTVDLYSNTKIGHAIYEKWLTNKLSQLNLQIKIVLIPTELTKLNDSKGIYNAVNDCIDRISSIDSNEKQVTVYLSPGTPLMAFTWAFASLVNPALNISVIASSDSRNSPEKIDLPYELLDIMGQKQDEKFPIGDYDVIFHLFGAQRMPSVLGVFQFKCKMHIFVNSKKYPADIMEQFMGESIYKELPVNPFDPKNVEMKILQEISKLSKNSKIGFNLTGGTKLMFVGALSASDKVNGTPFYFETQGNNLVFLKDYSFYQTKLIRDVETFIKANTNNFKISNHGIWGKSSARNKPDKQRLTNELWDKRNKISSLYRELSDYIDYPGKSFDLERSDFRVKLNRNGDAEISTGVENYRFVNWPDFAKYLCGGWLEEYAYHLLEPLVDSGDIKDLRIGMEISFIDNTNQQKMDWKDNLRKIHGELYQELDIVFTDGKSLFIVECKAGKNVKSADVMKLQNNVRYYGGVQGKGILATAFKPKNKVVKKKISESKNITLVSGINFRNILKCIP